MHPSLSLLRGDEELEATISAEVLHDLLERKVARHTGSQPKTEPRPPDQTRPANRPPSSLPEFTVDGVSSYHMYSNVGDGSKKGLPAIIFLGHPERPRENHRRFAGKFDEPVLLIWCDLFFGLDHDTQVDDPALWRKKRQEFVRLYGRYKERFGFDPRSVYLTGVSFPGVYSWMLAYDRPDLYAGVVAMSAVSYPEQIQETLKSGASVVTVVVRGEKDAAPGGRLALEKETGRAIESLNPRSRFILKPGEDHGGPVEHWLEYLNYILQSSRADSEANCKSP